MGFQFGIAVGEKTRGRQRFNGLRELLLGARFPRLRLVHGVGAFLADLLPDLAYS
jgi:hypothetical protein